MNYYTFTGADGQPNVLVRLQWPKVQEYVTKDHPFWRKDPDLAEVEWDSTGDICSLSNAEKLMSDWGADS